MRGGKVTRADILQIVAQVKQLMFSCDIEQHQVQVDTLCAVPQADVIITNPTHYAVALQYEAATMAAPKLVAKGIDDVALRIREAAEDLDIPIVENPPLARAIYATVEIDQEVQADHYKAVAEVIGYVMKVKGDATRRKFTEEVGAEAIGA